VQKYIEAYGKDAAVTYRQTEEEAYINAQKFRFMLAERDIHFASILPCKLWSYVQQSLRFVNCRKVVVSHYNIIRSTEGFKIDVENQVGERLPILILNQV